MKTILILLLALCFSLNISAQNVTQEALQGSWRLVYLEGDGIAANYETRTYTMTDEFKQKHTPEELASMEKEAQAMFDAGFGLELVFLGNTATYKIDVMDDVKAGTFELKPGTATLLILYGMDSNGKTKTFEPSFKDDKLYMKEVEPQQTTFVYSKIK